MNLTRRLSLLEKRIGHGEHCPMCRGGRCGIRVVRDGETPKPVRCRHCGEIREPLRVIIIEDTPERVEEL